jgi:hypothetical protein
MYRLEFVLSLEDDCAADERNGAKAKSPTQSSAVAVAATASVNNGSTGRAQGGGIGIFAKKHADAPNATKNDVTVGTMNSMKELLSVADLSRFDIDLVSKNTESSGTLLAKNPPDVSVVAPGLGSHHVGVEVPKTIPMSGDDDVDDDLTIGTTVAEGVDPFSQDKRKVVNSIECEPCTPTKSPYFADSLNNQAVEQTVVHAVDTTSKTADPKEASKSASVQGGIGAKLPAPRVSLSPPPGLDAPRPGLNKAASYSLQGHMDASAGDDDNSIVIPGIPASVANLNVEGNSATSGIEMGNVGLRSVSKSDSTNRNSWLSNMGASAEEDRIGLFANGQKSITKNATTQSAHDRPITTIQSRGIDKLVGRSGKVKFASATNSDSNTTNSFKKSKVASGAPFANSELAMNTTLSLTAITPDQRQLFLQDSASIVGNITPTPHEVIAPEPTPEASIPGTTPTTDFAMEKEVPSKTPCGRSRSQTIYTPTLSANAGSIPSKASNMNPTVSSEGFDELLSEFVSYIQEGADIYEKGQSDLLELEVDLSHAFAAVLRYKDEYTTLLSEIDCVQAKAEHIISEISN